ncbi:MAG: class I SAM-dependent methyltransferase [Gammaproteobacteria bacterium]|nr:class I SAM-dependent methyltransferase [Gammaproteobacteria bacterium]
MASEQNTKTDNAEIWRFFQNQAADSFNGAKPRLDYLIKAVQRYAGTASPSVLNIGVGNGYFETTAKARGYQVHALDLDEETVARLNAAGITAACAPMEEMPYDDAMFDVVVASEVLEHLDPEQMQAGLRQIARVLKPGGTFIGTVPYRENLEQSMVICPDCGKVFHRWGHQRSFDETTLSRELGLVFPSVNTKITGYLSFQNPSFYRVLDSIARYLLAMLRMPISSTSLFFAATRSRT